MNMGVWRVRIGGPQGENAEKKAAAEKTSVPAALSKTGQSDFCKPSDAAIRLKRTVTLVAIGINHSIRLSVSASNR